MGAAPPRARTSLPHRLSYRLFPRPRFLSCLLPRRVATMAKQAPPSAQPDLTLVPLLGNESVYIGIDIGKSKHVAGFLSHTLLARHDRFEACPALVFENSREGFRLLVERIRSYCPWSTPTCSWSAPATITVPSSSTCR